MRCLGLRINEGVRIIGGDISIDVIVRSIGGTKRFREAVVEVHGVPSISTLHIKHSDGPYWLDSKIGFGIRNDAKNRSSRGRVPMYFSAPLKYHFDRRFYPLLADP